MQQYKMSFLDNLSVVITARNFEGADDSEALEHAYSLCGTHTIRVTQAGRHVGEAAKGTLRGAPVA